MSMRALIWISARATRLAGLVLISFVMLGAAVAQDADPPGRVARLSFLQGAVSLEPAGQQDWVTAELNRPLTTNDRIWSDAQGSRAELDLGGAVVRLGPDTGFSFLNLDDSAAQMQVSSGTVVVRVRELLEGQSYEVDTPNVALLLDQPGQYRIDVNEAGDTTAVKVSDGQAEASGGGQTVPIPNQEMMTFFGTDQLSMVPASLGAPDGFDDWSFERDREMDQGVSQQYVPPDMVGTEDLDDNGQWQDSPDYGAVWVPTAVAVGWVPYSFGHWAWVSPWGWTWIDEASWGFAPFHYGRWARWHNSWCWVPGPRSVRAVYAPALVAWSGSAGGAGVAWFPLAPREVYVPGYRVSERYVRSVNVANTSIADTNYINNVYQNRVSGIRYANSAVPGAVTSVSRNVFTSAQPVNTHRSVLSANQVAQLAPMARAPAIQPIRQSVMGASQPGLVRRPPASVLSHPVVARTAPPMATGVHVRLVGPGVSQQGRAFASRPAVQQANRPGSNVAPQARPLSERQARESPVGAGPSQQGEVDNRSWAERAHALGQSSLPPAAPRPIPNNSGAAREYNDENYRPGGVRPQELSNELNRSSTEEEERASQPAQTRPSVNTFSRPSESESQNRVEEERRVVPSVPTYQRPAEAPRVPETRYAPPSAPNFQRPAEAPRIPESHFTPPQPPRPQAAPVQPAPSPPQQHAPAREERGGGRPPSRNDQNPR
jgi:hypothetical protein